jgi:hypothetical protein
MYGGSQAGGPAWSPSEVGSVIYPGDSPTQPSRTMQRAVPYREDSPMGYRGPPSPVRTAEDVFTPRSAGHDWTTSGYVPTQADYERIRSTSRQGRAATGADDRYNAARDASNITQMTPVGLNFNSQWDPDAPYHRAPPNYMPNPGAADAQQPSSPPRRPAQERAGSANLSRPRRRSATNNIALFTSHPLTDAKLPRSPPGYCVGRHRSSPIARCARKIKITLALSLLHNWAYNYCNTAPTNHSASNVFSYSHIILCVYITQPNQLHPVPTHSHTVRLSPLQKYKTNQSSRPRGTGYFRCHTPQPFHHDRTPLQTLAYPPVTHTPRRVNV